MRVWFAGAAVALFGLNVGVAQAATTIGQSPPSAGATPASCTQVVFRDLAQRASVSGTSYVVPPGNGVITSWTSSVATGALEEKLRVFTLNTLTTMVPTGESTDHVVTLAPTRFTTHIPVVGGQVIGMAFRGNATGCAFSDAPAENVLTAANNATSGPLNVSEMATDFTGTLVNITADVEADADNDDFGDETEDLCPTDATKQGECVAPSALLGKTPKKKSKSATATFKFSSDDPAATFQCAIDKKTLKACESPKKFRKLKIRKHRFNLVATDAAGNASALTSFHWRVVE